MSKIFPGLTSSTYNSGRGKNSHVQVSSNHKPGGGYQDLHSIHVRKEVELSVVNRPADGSWSKPRHATDSEEWMFRP
jgi:hypothetical protein